MDDLRMIESDKARMKLWKIMGPIFNIINDLLILPTKLTRSVMVIIDMSA